MKPIDKTTATIEDLETWLTCMAYALRGAKDIRKQTIDASTRLLVEEDIEVFKQEIEETKKALNKAHLKIGEKIEFQNI